MANPISPEEQAQFRKLFPEIPTDFSDKGQFLNWLDQNPNVKQTLAKANIRQDPWEMIKPSTPLPNEQIVEDLHATDKEHGHESHGHSGHEELSEDELKDALLQNEHYQNILENTVDDWNKLHPNEKIKSVFTTDEHGKKEINPEVTKKIDDIEKRAEETYSMAFGTQRLKAAKLAETRRVYKKADADPLYNKLLQEIKAGKNPNDVYDEFVRRYPGKAYEYQSKRKFKRGSKEYVAFQNAIQRRKEYQKKEKKELDTKYKEKLNQQKQWDKAYNKARGPLWRKNPTAQHDAVAAFNADTQQKIDKAIEAERIADQKKGVSYSKDVYDKRVREKVRKGSLDSLFRENPVHAQYLMRYDSTLRKEFEAWQKEEKAKNEKEAKEAQERAKIYKNPKDDPTLKALNDEVNALTHAEYQQQLVASRAGKGRYIRGIWYPDPKSNYVPPNQQTIEATIRKQKLLEYTQKHPDKVAAYAKSDTEMASAHEVYKEQQQRKQQARRLAERRGIRQRIRSLFRKTTTVQSQGLTLGQTTVPVNTITPTLSSPPQTQPLHPQPMQVSQAQKKDEDQKKASLRQKLSNRFNGQNSRLGQLQQRLRAPSQALSNKRNQLKKSLGKAIDSRTGGLGSRLNNKLGKFGKLPKSPEDLAKKGAEQLLKRGIFSPPVLTGIGIAIVVLIFIILIFAIILGLTGGTDEIEELTPTPSPSISPIPQQLTIEKTGPGTSTVNGDLTYTLIVNTENSASGEILVTDTITGDVDYVSASPEPRTEDILRGEANKLRSVVWRLSEPGTITLTVRPTQDDSYIYNRATASTGDITTPPETAQPLPPGTPPDLTSNDFEELMTRQGRNISVLGNEDAFIEAIFANVNSQRTLSNRSTYEPYLKQIYQQAVAKNINPLIPLVIWGVESSYEIHDHVYNCPRDGRSDFAAQLACSLETIDEFMTTFESTYNGTDPVAYQSEACTYTDPFIYAYEAYTPVCWLDDQNNNARSNFVILFKEFLGAEN